VSGGRAQSFLLVSGIGGVTFLWVILAHYLVMPKFAGM
jgi:hypothetical protein